MTIDRTTFGTSDVAGVDADTIADTSVTPSVTDPTTLDYVKVGGSVKVEVSVAPAVATTIVHNVSLTYTEGGVAKTSEAKPLAIGAVAATPGKVEITISNVQGAIDDITAVVATPPAAAPVNYDAANSTLTANGVEVTGVTLSANAATAKIGDTVTLTMTIKGPASAASTITIAGAGVGSSSNESFSANAQGGALSVNSAKVLGVAANIALPETTVTWTYTVGATGAITITVA